MTKSPTTTALTGVPSSATTLFRMVGYCLLLTAAAFVQQPGRLVGDTKFDLVVDPARFLGRAWHLWDPVAAFGQVQNQAYGYFFPMGPFFLAGHAAALPEWVVQRLWWAMMLCLAFVGTVLLAKALRLGTPAAQVLGGFAYALSAHVLALLGPTSVEAWPTALAPWVLLPLVVGAERGSPRRFAALSALAVAACGGVNAVAVSAVLPVGVVWLVTRERGSRRRALMTWWPILTVAATLWWSVPLLLLGRYSPPFLDYIENAAITTSTTSLPDVLMGTSDWVAYASPQDWIAGHLLGTTPLLLVDAAVVAGLGLAGICRRDNPHSRFLLLSVLAGVVIVTWGWTGPVHGWFAVSRQHGLDGLLAPLRNLHKFDAVLRLPLALGLVHLVAVYGGRPHDAGARAFRAGVLLACAFSVVGVAIPVASGKLAPGASVKDVPGYWSAAAHYLKANDDGSRVLELPASPFVDYFWVSPHEDILQALAQSPWAVRNIVPLAQPGNVRLLDAVTRATELGRPDPRLAEFLTSNGIGRLVVRNDLAPFRSESPDPVVLHQVLDRSPGLTRVASFGPGVGVPAQGRTAGGRPLLTDRGRSAAYPAVEIYQVGDGAAPVTAWKASSVPVVSGDPGSRLSTAAAAVPGLLVGDDRATRPGGSTFLTDGLRRQETAFTAVRRNESATMTRGEPWRLSSVEHNHRLFDDQGRWETTATWDGVAGVTASTSQAWADAAPPILPAQSPAAALDGRRWTQFVSASKNGAVGQWWRLRLERSLAPARVRLTMGRTDAARVNELALVTAAGRLQVRAPAPGESATFELPKGRTRFVEVRAVQVAGDPRGSQLALAEVRLPDVAPHRLLATPLRPFRSAPAHIVLTRDPQRSSCSVVDGTTVCDDFQRTRSEDANLLRRRVVMPSTAEYRVDLTARLGFSPRTARLVARQLPVQVYSTRPLSTDPRGSALATVDGDHGTTWVAAADTVPRLTARWKRPVSLSRIQLVLGDHAAASAPSRVTIVAGDRRRVVSLDRAGQGRFPPLRTRRIDIGFDATRPTYSAEGGGVLKLPVGVSELRLPQVPVARRSSAYDPLDLGCGSGPTLRTGTSGTTTRVRSSLSELLSGDPFPVETCGSTTTTPLRRGVNDVLVGASPVSVPEQLTLDRADAPAVAPVRVPLKVVSWGASSREVRLPARRTPTLLVVDENLNAGWRATLPGLHGRSMPAQRVDGWKQGFVAPPGPAGVVSLDFTPNRPYQLALLVGLLAALGVALVAWRWPGPKRLPAASTARGAGWADAGVFVLTGGLVAGWPGALVVVAALVAGRNPAVKEYAGWLAAVLVAMAGGTTALLRVDSFHPHSTTAQVLACLALGVAVVGANGPELFSRRRGRSST